MRYSIYLCVLVCLLLQSCSGSKTTPTAAEAAVGPVFDMADIATDEHYAARQMIPIVGSTPMQGLIAQLSKTPGVLGWEGRPLDADREDILKRGWKQ